MAKAEWGTKRTCPKCGERFYDLGKEDPAICIACGNEWVPEPILKAKQPHIAEEAEDESDDDDILLDDDDDVVVPADDDSAGVAIDDDEDDDMSDVIDAPIKKVDDE